MWFPASELALQLEPICKGQVTKLDHRLCCALAVRAFSQFFSNICFIIEQRHEEEISAYTFVTRYSQAFCYLRIVLLFMVRPNEQTQVQQIAAFA